jgi:hypothetical protein
MGALELDIDILHSPYVSGTSENSIQQLTVSFELVRIYQRDQLAPFNTWVVSSPSHTYVIHHRLSGATRLIRAGYPPEPDPLAGTIQRSYLDHHGGIPLASSLGPSWPT